ncbi:hypothetical protein BC828DRAFT_396269 [Blastocladiella britannica]|nr:hypothetical protein BC828DRAFT_396269 [Blastocladiella britannica]
MHDQGDFEKFLTDYKSTPKEHKSRVMRGLARKGDKMRKFVLSTFHEATIRRMDEVVSKVVAEVNTLLQVEEMYNLNNMSDSLRAVLSRLNDSQTANEELVRSLEQRVFGSIKGMREELATNNHVLRGVNNNVSQMAKTLLEIHRDMNALPGFLKSVKSTEVRDLWRNRDWPDALELQRFGRGFDDFLDYSFTNVSFAVRQRIVHRACTDLERLNAGKRFGAGYLAPSDLERLFPGEESLVDFLVASELGWLVYLQYLAQRMHSMADQLETNPHKSSRLVKDLDTVLAPLIAAYPIDPEMSADVVVVVDRDLPGYSARWPQPARTLVQSLNTVVKLISNSFDDSLSRGEELFSASLLGASSTESRSFGDGHATLAVTAPQLYEVLEMADDAPSPGELLTQVNPEDDELDASCHTKLQSQFQSIRRNLVMMLTDPQVPTEVPTAAVLARFFVKMANIARLTPVEILGLQQTYTGIHHGIPVLVHVTPVAITNDLPADVIAYVQATREPHPALLNVRGVASLNGYWALVLDLPVAPVMTLQQLLATHTDLSNGTKVALARDVISAVQYIHAQGHTHNALSTLSVLVDAKLTVRVIGGVESGGWIRQGLEADLSRYAAPEHLLGFTKTSSTARETADLWSIGALLVAIFTGSEFLGNLADDNVLEAIKDGQFTMPSLPALGDGALAAAILANINAFDMPSSRTPLEELDAVLWKLIQDGVVGPALTPASMGGAAAANGSSRPTSLYSADGMSALSARGGGPPPRQSSRAASDYSQSSPLPAYSMENGDQHHHQMPMSGAGPTSGIHRDALAEAIQALSEGNVQKAIQLFETAYTVYMQYDALHFLGDIYYFGNGGIKVEYARAYEYYLKATQNGSRSGHIGLGDCYLFNLGLPDRVPRATRLEQAKHHYTLAFRDHPDPPTRLLCGLADLEYYTSQAEGRSGFRTVQFSMEAEARYQVALAREPTYYRALVGMADVLLSHGDNARAREQYLTVAEAMPDLKRVWIGLVLSSDNHNDRDSFGLLAEQGSDH